MWRLHILEYLIMKTKEKGIKLDELLKIVSQSLDIGVKIYSIRVDEVHKITLQLAYLLSSLVKDNKAISALTEGDNE